MSETETQGKPEGSTRLAPVSLLACPFCGCTDIQVSADKRTGLNGHVWCDGDECEAGMYGEDRQQAIERWNRRQANAALSHDGKGNK